MTTKFCNNCNNFLDRISSSETFYFKCAKCQEITQPNPIDTMLKEEQKGTDMNIYENILLNAGRDPVTPKVKKNCRKCSNNILKQVRLGKNMRLIYICIECNEQWMEGTGNE